MEGLLLKQISELKPSPKNARTHTPEQITEVANSIQEFGFTNPILIGKDNVLIAGHCRLLAAKEVGLEEVPCIDLSRLSKQQAKAYLIADNQLAQNSGWDRDILKTEIQELDEIGFDLSLLGFTQDYLDDLLADDTPIEGFTDGDAIPEDVDTRCKLGDVWLLGEHRLMCGNATSIDNVSKLVDGSVINLWLTDPPYNVDYTGKTKDKLKIENDLMSDGNFKQFLVDSYIAADSVMAAGASFYIWHADSEGYNFRGAAHDMGWQIRQCLVWNKSVLVMGRQDYHWKHEPCLYGWKEGAAHCWNSDRKQTTVLEFNKPNRNGEHPTMKPVELFSYLITNSSKKGDNVLDTFGGSGTTLIACERAGRKCFMMELDPKYCDVILKRWEDFTGKQAAREEPDGQS